MTKVAAYARVSSNSKAQEHSLEFQKHYWMDTLSQNQLYEFVGLYADQGISGKLASRRPQFLQMINKAKQGGIDLIFTKSVQRFARNTEELLTIVRELRDIGVGVIFEKEGINTLEMTSDLYLTVAVAIAEEDLSRYSQNVTWSIQKRYQEGVHGSLGGRVYGYNVINNQLYINEEEANVVRKIFELYASGKSYRDLIDYLYEEGIKSPYGKDTWGLTTLRGILRQEKYIGDMLLQKLIKVGTACVLNDGSKDQYYVEGTHEAIISTELWNKVQEQLEERTNDKNNGRTQRIYPFTGLIQCSCCGCNMHHKFNRSSKVPRGQFRCKGTRDVCTSTNIRDDILMELFIEAYNEFVSKRYKGVEEEDVIAQIESVRQEQADLEKMYYNGWIQKSDYQQEKETLINKANDLKIKLESYNIRSLAESDFTPITIFDPDKVEKFIEKCVVIKNTIEFHFYNGVIITKQVINRRRYDYDVQL